MNETEYTRIARETIAHGYYVYSCERKKGVWVQPSGRYDQPHPHNPAVFDRNSHQDLARLDPDAPVGIHPFLNDLLVVDIDIGKAGKTRGWGDLDPEQLQSRGYVMGLNGQGPKCHRVFAFPDPMPEHWTQYTLGTIQGIGGADVDIICASGLLRLKGPLPPYETIPRLDPVEDSVVWRLIDDYVRNRAIDHFKPPAKEGTWLRFPADRVRTALQATHRSVRTAIVEDERGMEAALQENVRPYPNASRKQWKASLAFIHCLVDDPEVGRDLAFEWSGWLHKDEPPMFEGGPPEWDDFVKEYNGAAGMKAASLPGAAMHRIGIKLTPDEAAANARADFFSVDLSDFFGERTDPEPPPAPSPGPKYPGLTYENFAHLAKENEGDWSGILDALEDYNRTHFYVSEASGLVYYKSSGDGFKAMTASGARDEYTRRPVRMGGKKASISISHLWVKYARPPSHQVRTVRPVPLGQKVQTSIGIPHPGTETGMEWALNLSYDWKITPADTTAPAKPLLDFIFYAIAGGNLERYEYILNWLARMAQVPNKPAGTALFLYGDQGGGKGLFSEIIFRMTGNTNESLGVHLHRGEDIWGKNNDRLQGRVFVYADETSPARDQKQIEMDMNRMKALITEKTITIERKYVPAFGSPNTLHIVVAANKPNAITLSGGQGDRRYAFFEVRLHPSRGAMYFNRLARTIAEDAPISAFARFLLDRDVTRFDPQREIPHSFERVGQLVSTLPPVSRELLVYLRDAIKPFRYMRFQGKLIVEADEVVGFYNAHFRTGIRRKEVRSRAQSDWGVHLKDAFRIRHPMEPASTDRPRPRIWVFEFPGPRELCEAFVNAHPFAKDEVSTKPDNEWTDKEEK